MIITRYINGIAVSEEDLRGYNVSNASIDIFGQAVNRVRARLGRPSGKHRKNARRNSAIM